MYAMRILPLVLAAGLWTLTGCATSSPDESPYVDPALEQEEEKAEDQGPPEVTRPGKTEGVARVGEWAWKAPTNVVWWPWKIVGRGLRGAGLN